MSEIVFKGLDKLEKQIRQKVENALKDKQLRKDVGELVMKNMQISLKQGKDPNTRKGHKKKISKTWKERRKELSSSNNTSEFYKESRALVFTEQLINSLTVEINTKTGKIEIKPKGIHKPYKSKTGKPVGSAVKNEDLAKWLEEKGFNVFGYHEQTVKSVLTLLNKRIKKLL